MGVLCLTAALDWLKTQWAPAFILLKRPDLQEDHGIDRDQ